jgi:4-amino-4-deoxy-L-arabinose transferase-like glycosyltransferase
VTSSRIRWRSGPAAALGLVLAALAIRLLPLPWVEGPVSRAAAQELALDGTLVYLPLADSLARGDGLALTPGHPTASFMPLYPIYLAILERLSLLGGDGVVVQQALLGAVLLLLLFVWIRDRWGARTALAASLLAALLPDFAVYSYLNLSENLALLWVLASLVAFERAGRRGGPLRYGLAGLGMGAAGLTREFGVTLLAPLGLILVQQQGLRRALRDIGVMFGGALLALLPWIVRNGARFGEFIPLTDKGANNFYIGTLKTRYHLSDARQQWIVEDPEQRRSDERLTQDLARAGSMREKNRLYLDAAWRNIAADPSGQILQLLRRSGFFWGANVGSRHSGRFGFGPLFVLSEILYYTTALAAVASVLWTAPWKPPNSLAWALIGWTFLFHLLVGEAEPRYHFLLLPAVFSLAGTTVIAILDRRRAVSPRASGAARREQAGGTGPCP